jgi:DNA helicase-2/ATP-dependent DNA helicase PcrA
MRRVLLRPSRGIGEVTIKAVVEEGRECGFSLTDMASGQTFTDGDPFSDLLKAYSSGVVTVFDVETTGFSVNQDEVVEIAAVRLIEGKVQAEFHAYITNQVSVGDSQRIHGHSDDFLAEHGQSAKDVFAKFFKFAENSMVVGHNVSFDIKMVTTQAQKVGIEVPSLKWEDTLELANRFIESERYSLEVLSRFGYKVRATSSNLNNPKSLRLGQFGRKACVCVPRFN